MNVFDKLFNKLDESLETPLENELLTSGKNKLVFGKLHATWCGHCVRLAEIWPEIVSRIESKVNNVLIISIESEVMDDEVKKVNDALVSKSSPKLALQEGYPTIFKIVRGRVHYYNGTREIEPMVAWAVGTSKTRSVSKKRKDRRAYRTHTRRRSRHHKRR
jgi:thiol-disulfide isomerase/thioredoxin